MSRERCILVCDDQVEIRDLAASVLRGAGFEVMTAADGRQAIERLHEVPVDLVLLDINMPVLDGWQTLRLIRGQAAHDDLPVVMFSVKGEIADKVTSLQEGAVDYVTKPFGVDDLVDRVQKILDERAAAGDEP